MAKILFFGRFSDLSGPLEIELPKDVEDKKTLASYLSTLISGFGELAERPDTRISVNMMVSPNEVEIKNDDEIAFMSALSGG